MAEILITLLGLLAVFSTFFYLAAKAGEDGRVGPSDMDN